MKTSLAGCKATLEDEIQSLRKLDSVNQNQLSGGKGQILTNRQLHLLTEGLFFSAFRAYEQFIKNIFVLYCCGLQPSRRRLVKSYLHPRTMLHVEDLVQSSMPFLDWSSPDILLERAETYLKDGYPIKIPITSNIDELRDLKRIRNHIAHMSKESTSEFKKTLKKHYSVVPIAIPRPGEYLLLTSRRVLNSYYLLDYFELIARVAGQMT